jgi:hypothetical protein
MTDTKDWTWVLERPCPECGFVADALARADIAPRTREVADAFVGFLAADDVRERPSPDTWSTLEYGCHIRDVCRVMHGRLELMLATDGARFENWDQDRTAVEDRYEAQDPAVVAGEVRDWGERLAEGFASVPDDRWGNRGLRSNGSEFTVETLGRYAVHDLVHHVWDIEQAANP